MSAEVRQSAAAGLLWLREGQCYRCGNVAGGPLRKMSHLVLRPPLQFDRQAGIPYNGRSVRRHIYSLTRSSDVVEQAAVEEGLNCVNGSDVVLMFPSFDEGNEPGGVQM